MGKTGSTKWNRSDRTTRLLTKKKLNYYIMKFYLRILGTFTMIIAILFEFFDNNNMLKKYFITTAFICFLLPPIIIFINFLKNNYFKKD